MKKVEILWLFKHFCKHGHRYVEHPECLKKEKPNTSPIKEKLGYLDIETTGLNANWDYIISFSLLSDGGKLCGRELTRNEALNYRILDRELMKEFSESIKNFDRIVVYWGKDRRHDLPFLRTRCLKWRVDFPLYRDIFVTDCYDIVKNKLRLHRNRLQNACEFLNIPAKRHPLNPEMWQRAKLGDKKALRYIWLHNKEDAYSLRGVFRILEGFSSSRKASI